MIGANATRDHYLSTTFLAIFLVLIALSCKKDTENIIAKIGRQDSLYIYLFHVAVMMIMESINKRLQIEWSEQIYPYIAPFVVLILTMLLVWTLRTLKLIK